MVLDSLQEDYGPRAVWDDLVMRSQLKRVGGIVEETYLPVLRLLADDPATVDREYEEVKAQRRPLSWRDSPRASWRKRYGNFVRELEWVCSELRPRMAEPDFHELITSTIANRLESWIGWMKPLMESGDTGLPGGMKTVYEGPLADRMAGVVGLSSFLVGPVEIRCVEDGVIETYIPRCAMHTVVSETEPQTYACLYGCKAACERLFGPDDVMSFHFEPNLPEFDCVLRIRMGKAADQDGVLHAPREPQEVVLS